MARSTIKYLLAVVFALLAQGAFASDNEAKVDTLIAVDKVQITAFKQGSELRREAVTASVLGGRTLEMRGVTAVKDVVTDIPNLFMPDYGSRTTSSVYVRGMGSCVFNGVLISSLRCK